MGSLLTDVYLNMGDTVIICLGPSLLEAARKLAAQGKAFQTQHALRRYGENDEPLPK